MKTVAEFSIHYHQYLNEQSEIVQKLPDFANDTDHLIRLYTSMQRTRMLDAKAVLMQRTGKMGTYPSSFGQEAVSTGLGDAMRPEDVFCPYYRDQGALLERGVTIAEILTYWAAMNAARIFKCRVKISPPAYRLLLNACMPVAWLTPLNIANNLALQ